tara:strand:+ start:2924 stop:3130 length:207 start_codon:yes stop_codon:yes gene_type:complete
MGVSKNWLRFNDDSRARQNRARYVAENGGRFVRVGRAGWRWEGTKPESKPAPKPTVKKSSTSTTKKKK